MLAIQPWTRNRSELGLENIALHDLRHTYLTMLVHSGANIKVAQDIAGHSKIDMLMSIYTHKDTNEEQRAVDNLERILNTDVPLDVPEALSIHKVRT